MGLLSEIEDVLMEDLRHKISALLMNNSEQNPLDCYITIGEDEAMGLSSLELPTVIQAFQEPSEGIIWFRMEGMEEPIEFDSFRVKDLEDIYEGLLEQS